MSNGQTVYDYVQGLRRQLPKKEAEERAFEELGMEIDSIPVSSFGDDVSLWTGPSQSVPQPLQPVEREEVEHIPGVVSEYDLAQQEQRSMGSLTTPASLQPQDVEAASIYSMPQTPRNIEHETQQGIAETLNAFGEKWKRDEGEWYDVANLLKTAAEVSAFPVLGPVGSVAADAALGTEISDNAAMRGTARAAGTAGRIAAEAIDFVLGTELTESEDEAKKLSAYLEGAKKRDSALVKERMDDRQFFGVDEALNIAKDAAEIIQGVVGVTGFYTGITNSDIKGLSANARAGWDMGGELMGAIGAELVGLTGTEHGNFVDTARAKPLSTFLTIVPIFRVLTAMKGLSAMKGVSGAKLKSKMQQFLNKWGYKYDEITAPDRAIRQLPEGVAPDAVSSISRPPFDPSIMTMPQRAARALGEAGKKASDLEKGISKLLSPIAGPSAWASLASKGLKKVPIPKIKERLAENREVDAQEALDIYETGSANIGDQARSILERRFEETGQDPSKIDLEVDLDSGVRVMEGEDGKPEALGPGDNLSPGALLTIPPTIRRIAEEERSKGHSGERPAERYWKIAMSELLSGERKTYGIMLKEYKFTTDEITSLARDPQKLRETAVLEGIDVNGKTNQQVMADLSQVGTEQKRVVLGPSQNAPKGTKWVNRGSESPSLAPDGLGYSVRELWSPGDRLRGRVAKDKLQSDVASSPSGSRFQAVSDSGRLDYGITVELWKDLMEGHLGGPRPNRTVVTNKQIIELTQFINDQMGLETRGLPRTKIPYDKSTAKKSIDWQEKAQEAEAAQKLSREPKEGDVYAKDIIEQSRRKDSTSEILDIKEELRASKRKKEGMEEPSGVEKYFDRQKDLDEMLSSKKETPSFPEDDLTFRGYKAEVQAGVDKDGNPVYKTATGTMKQLQEQELAAIKERYPTPKRKLDIKEIARKSALGPSKFTGKSVGGKPQGFGKLEIFSKKNGSKKLTATGEFDKGLFKNGEVTYLDGSKFSGEATQRRKEIYPYNGKLTKADGEELTVKDGVVYDQEGAPLPAKDQSKGAAPPSAISPRKNRISTRKTKAEDSAANAEPEGEWQTVETPTGESYRVRMRNDGYMELDGARFVEVLDSRGRSVEGIEPDRTFEKRSGKEAVDHFEMLRESKRDEWRAREPMTWDEMHAFEDYLDSGLVPWQRTANRMKRGLANMKAEAVKANLDAAESALSKAEKDAALPSQPKKVSQKDLEAEVELKERLQKQLAQSVKKEKKKEDSLKDEALVPKKSMTDAEKRKTRQEIFKISAGLSLRARQQAFFNGLVKSEKFFEEIEKGNAPKSLPLGFGDLDAAKAIKYLKDVESPSKEQKSLLKRLESAEFEGEPKYTSRERKRLEKQGLTPSEIEAQLGAVGDGWMGIGNWFLQETKSPAKAEFRGLMAPVGGKPSPIASYMEAKGQRLMVPKGVNESLAFMNVLREAQKQSDFLSQAKALTKRGLVARRLRGIANAFMGNWLTEALTDGNLAAPVFAIVEATEFQKWKSNPSSVSKDKADFFNNSEANGLASGDFISGEIGKTLAELANIPTGVKAWDALRDSKAVQALGKFNEKQEVLWKFVDHSYKLRRAWRSYSKSRNDFQEMSAGNSALARVSKVREIEIKKLDSGEWVVGGKNVGKSKDGVLPSRVRKVLTDAAAYDANSKYFDYRFKSRYQAYLSTNSVAAFASPFYSWLFYAMSAPGKKGLAGAMLQTESSIKHTDPKIVLRQNIRKARASARLFAATQGAKGDVEGLSDEAKKAVSYGNLAPVVLTRDDEDNWFVKSLNNINPWQPAMDLSSTLGAGFLGLSSSLGLIDSIDDYDPSNFESHEAANKEYRKLINRAKILATTPTVKNFVDFVGLGGGFGVNTLRETVWGKEDFDLNSVASLVLPTIIGGTSADLVDALVGAADRGSPLTKRSRDPKASMTQTADDYAVASILSLGARALGKGGGKALERQLKSFDAAWNSKYIAPLRKKIEMAESDNDYESAGVAEALIAKSRGFREMARMALEEELRRVK